MTDHPTLDELDQRITNALQLNGRASWRQIATALDAPESTVARRGQALLAEHVVTVTGVLDHLRCGLGISVHMRFRTRPGRVEAVAEAVAALPTSRFVNVTTGSFDVAAELVVPSHRHLPQVLAEIAHLDDVQESESMLAIRKFAAFEEWNPGNLDSRAVDTLRSVATVTDYPHRDWLKPEQLSDLEFEIARVLAADGRTTYATVAARVGVSEATAARKVESMVRRGCLRFRTIFDSSAVGLGVELYQWLTVDPIHLEAAGERLAKLPSTRYLSAATGRFNLVLEGALPGYGDLYHYASRIVGDLPGVVSHDLTLQVRTLKRAWIHIGPDGRARERSGPEWTRRDIISPTAGTPRRKGD